MSPVSFRGRSQHGKKSGVYMSHPGRNELHRSSARLAYAVALALAGAAPAHVLAQAAPPTPAVPAIPATPPENLPNTPEGEKETQELETIVVTGFRASLEVSLDMKRESAASVDTILAEDIAEFPDLNLAEAIQRIPGVAIARDAGEGRNISVRGLGPQFTRVRINGMEALSTAGGTDATGGTNRSRAFDFNIFASELFNSITVTKTASAATEEGSLGATVDLMTGRPFDYKGNQFVTSFQAGYNDLSGEVDPRMALLASGSSPTGPSARWSPSRMPKETSTTTARAPSAGSRAASGRWIPLTGARPRCRRSTRPSTPGSRATTTT